MEKELEEKLKLSESPQTNVLSVNQSAGANLALGNLNAQRGKPVAPPAGGVLPGMDAAMRERIAQRIGNFSSSRSRSAQSTPEINSPTSPQSPKPMSSTTSMAGSSPVPSQSTGLKRPNAPQLKMPGAAGGGGLSGRRGNMKMTLPGSGPGSNPVPANAAQENSFKKYADVVDAATGSLRFKGAVLSSEGIDFGNGKEFKISMNDIEKLDELGKGNYGTVTKVMHKPTKKIMAMKEIRLSLEEAVFSQIIMELGVLHQAACPEIVEFYGAFFVEGCVYIMMEFMDCGSLEKVYTTHVDEGVLAKITLATVRGLRTLKDKHNIIHRDVKPTNILVNSKGQVKLCDFGVSGNLVASIAKTNIGCQSYMAPERIKSENANSGPSTYTVQSDIWSLGLSILELAKGGYPYPPETYNNIFAQLQAICDGEPPNLPPDIYSDDARSFVKACLNKQPKLRPPYAVLLTHPWLEKYAEAEVDMVSWIAEAMQKTKDGKGEGVPKPALHSFQK